MLKVIVYELLILGGMVAFVNHHKSMVVLAARAEPDKPTDDAS